MSESRTVRALEKEVDKLNKRIKELEAENKQIRSIKCPPISDGDSCICPIEELEHKNQLLQITIAEALEECIGEDIEKATIILEQKDK